MMEVKCPYCNEVSEWKKSICPLCGKVALLPVFFKRSSRSGKEYFGRRRRDLGIPQPWMLQSGMWNVGQALGRLPKWVIWLSIIVVSGTYLQVSTIKPDYSKEIKRATDNMEVLRTALEYFKEHCGRYPTQAEGLAVLVKDPLVKGWEGPYVNKMRPDPWNHSFAYLLSNKGTVMIYSYGPDGKYGTEDDIVNLENKPESQEEALEDEGVPANIGRQ